MDDKDNVAGALMTMLLLKRQNVPLDRDVIFLAEAGEEGATRIGIQFMVNQHFDAIDAEYCFAEGGNVTRVGGKVKFASVQTLEKIPRAIKLTAKGTAGHGSVPLEDNAVAHLGEAVGAIAPWTPPTRLNETTATYFKRLAHGLDARGSGALPRRAQPGSDGGRAGAAVPAQERAAPLVDAPHVAVADHHPGRVSLERHSVGGDGQHRRAPGARRGSRRSSSSWSARW